MAGKGIYYESQFEEATIELLREAHWQYTFGDDIHRKYTDPLIEEDLRNFLAAQYKDRDLTTSEIDGIVANLRNTGGQNDYYALRNAFLLYRDGYDFAYSDGRDNPFRLEYIDFEHPDHNIFRCVNQFVMEQGRENRRPDILLFVNGIPVCIIELKNPTKQNATIRDAHTQICTRYMRDIPALLKYCALAVISDGAKNALGTIYTPFEFFYEWKKIENEDKAGKGLDTLRTLIRGALSPERILEILRNIFPADDEINRSITTGLNKLHEVISEMLQYVEKIEDCERTLNALPNPGQLIVTGIVKKNALNILMPTAEEESLVKYPSNQYKIDLEAIETIRTFLENNPLIEDANEEINSIKTKLTLAAKAYTMFDDVSMVVKEHKQVVDRILKDELGQQQSRITNKDSLLKTVGEYIKVLTGFKHCKQELIKIKYSFQTREIEARGHKLSVINNFIFNEKVLVDALKYCLKSNINTIADVTPWNLMSRYFKKNPNVESYNDMTQRVYTKLMELNTRSYKIITKDGKDFNSLSPGWKTAILLDLILGYEQDTAPIIIDQPEDNLAVKYINSTLTETIKAVKWSKQVIMVSHNATIPMMADAQTIVVCENDGNKITIRSASLESEVFGQKVLDYIADQTDGGRTSIKKRVKKYNFKKYN